MVSESAADAGHGVEECRAVTDRKGQTEGTVVEDLDQVIRKFLDLAPDVCRHSKSSLPDDGKIVQ
jgi:hypothetical protein